MTNALQAYVVQCYSNTGITPYDKYMVDLDSVATSFKLEWTNKDALSLIRIETSERGENLNAINIPVSIAQPTGEDCAYNWDYVRFTITDTQGNGASFPFWGRIEIVEPVNANTLRVHFSLDWWHTAMPQVGTISAMWQRIPAEPLAGNHEFVYRSFAEPYNVPTWTSTYPDNAINDALKQLWGDPKSWGYGVFMSTDPQDNAASDDVKVWHIGGVPFVGFFQYFSDEASVKQCLANKYHNSGILHSSATPIAGHTIKIVRMPQVLADSADQLYMPAQVTLPLPDFSYQKFLSPQFLKATIYAGSSGQEIVLDVTQAEVTYSATDAVATFSFMLQLSGGMSPTLSLISLYGNEANGTPSFADLNNSRRVLQIDLPELPYADYITNRPTLWGNIKNSLSSLADGATAWAASERSTRAALSRAGRYAWQGIKQGARVTARTGGRGIIGGAAVAATGIGLGALEVAELGAKKIIPAAVGLGSEVGGLIEYNLGMSGSDYVFTGSSDQWDAYAFNRYRFELLITQPTDEGAASLADCLKYNGQAVQEWKELDTAKEGFWKAGGQIRFEKTNLNGIAILEIMRTLEGGCFFHSSYILAKNK